MLYIKQIASIFREFSFFIVNSQKIRSIHLLQYFFWIPAFAGMTEGHAFTNNRHSRVACPGILLSGSGNPEIWPRLIAKLFLISFIILFPATTVHSADVVLSWERPDDSRVTGYKIFYGSADTDFKSGPKEIIDTASQTSCDILNLTAGQTYGFAAKSTDDNGNESAFSKVIFYDVPDAQDKNSNNDNSNNTNVDSSDEVPIDHGSVSDQSTKSSGGGCFIHHVSNLK